MANKYERVALNLESEKFNFMCSFGWKDFDRGRKAMELLHSNGYEDQHFYHNMQFYINHLCSIKAPLHDATPFEPVPSIAMSSDLLSGWISLYPISRAFTYHVPKEFNCSLYLAYFEGTSNNLPVRYHRFIVTNNDKIVSVSTLFYFDDKFDKEQVVNFFFEADTLQIVYYSKQRSEYYQVLVNNEIVESMFNDWFHLLYKISSNHEAKYYVGQGEEYTTENLSGCKPKR